MKKIFINELENDIRNNLIKKNGKLIRMLQDELHELNLEFQEETTIYILGKNFHKYIDVKDHYTSFYLKLRDWRQFYDNLDKDYLSNETLNVYIEIQNLIDKLDNFDEYNDEYYNLENEIEKKCNFILQDIENLLHEYETYPSEDDSILYADDMEKLNDYYIELREDGTSDNVIRKDVYYTETFI